MSIADTHVARTVLHVYDHVQLGVQRDSGKCYRWQSAEMRDRTGKLCDINGARLQGEFSELRYIYLSIIRGVIDK